MAYPDSATETTTTEGEYRMLDDGSPDGVTDAFDKIIDINTRRPPDASNPDNWLSTVANPGTSLADLAIMVAPAAYLWDIAVRHREGLAKQVMYAAVGAGLGVIGLHVAKVNGWVK